jgi:hypothetical protein
MTFRTKMFRTETFRTIISGPFGTKDVRDNGHSEHSYDIQDNVIGDIRGYERSRPYLINLVSHHALGLFGHSGRAEQTKGMVPD